MIDLNNMKSGLLLAVNICMARRRWKRWPSIPRKLPQLWMPANQIPVKVVFKPVLTTPEAIPNYVWKPIHAQTLYWSDHLDAHFLPSKNVDCRFDQY